MGELFSFGDRELVPPKIECRSSQSVVISWARESSWEIRSLFLLAAELMSLGRWSYDSWCRELVSRAAGLMSLSPDYSIRRAFDFE